MDILSDKFVKSHAKKPEHGYERETFRDKLDHF